MAKNSYCCSAYEDHSYFGKQYFWLQGGFIFVIPNALVEKNFKFFNVLPKRAMPEIYIKLQQ